MEHYRNTINFNCFKHAKDGSSHISRLFTKQIYCIIL